jgi:hypothetical protein
VIAGYAPRNAHSSGELRSDQCGALNAARIP